MKMKVFLDENKLEIDGKEFIITNVVRNELNGRRSPSQVVRSIPDKKPVYPRQFPKGTWNIYGVEYTDDPVYAPVKIKTNAFHMLPVWSLTDQGHYGTKTEEYTRDEAYWLHYSHGSSTTLGCIRLHSVSDAFLLARIIEKGLEESDSIPLEVV